MKIAVPTSGNDLNADVDQRFGRCPRFLIVESETMEFRVVVNPAALQGGGAGTRAAQLVIDAGAKVVLAGEVGPNAYDVLERAGIRVVARVNGNVQDALDLLNAEMAENTDGPTVPAHHGR